LWYADHRQEEEGEKWKTKKAERRGKRRAYM
jgi:hypothetical protein